MIHVVDAENICQYGPAMEQAHRLRHAVFVDEMGWEELRKPDGIEIDQYDDSRAVHMLYIDDGLVLGYQRLLPTTQPHLLSDLFQDLCDGDRPVGPHVWEWTRYCVCRPQRERGVGQSGVADALIAAIPEWSLPVGIGQMIIELDPIWLLRLIQLHFRVSPLGLPKRMSGGDVIAITVAFDQRTVARLAQVRGDNRPLIVPRRAADHRLLA